MSIDHIDVSDRLRRVMLGGRLDIVGTEEIALQFAALTASGKHRVVVDLSAVSYLASIGIRAIVANARAMQARGTRLVLFVGNNELVAQTLEVTGIDGVIPMLRDLALADEAALA
ncbi:STAS domain-containing protein [Duganella qianjiadongensis]|uniref:STAS domain-containing protein n=1 Tax=Duganella qianjiadongensis TaxID=2692176 RepID=A0ABW9VQG7_9BURK|nr:STAS domain-containing protein [Duganella qianjiadongensis]MYM41735.1 STAS domain-containing protein [Duganella qianjiadongensis]